MKNEFIPYEEALAMKELGFDEPCVGIYHDNGQKGAFTFGMFQFPKRNSQVNTVSGTFIGEQGCYAPTFSQAFRWFREEHNIDCHIEKDRKNRYWFYITVNTLINKSSKFCYHRYEKAELACLRKLIEIVKENFD